MIPRVLEPEVMDAADDAADYDAMDHSGVNAAFVRDFFATRPDASKILDVGTGTALIPIEMARHHSTVRILGIDLADGMLGIARQNVNKAGYHDRIRCEKIDANKLPYAADSFSAVVSNSIVHHIPEPAACLAEMWRVCARGGQIFVRDLVRPDSMMALQTIVNRYAAADTVHQRQLFADSLHAALTLDEIRALIAALGDDPANVTMTSDRHWTWSSRKT
jgi:ubiquinone/menaquinone biosynthesis C-methylase UbiE